MNIQICKAFTLSLVLGVSLATAGCGGSSEDNPIINDRNSAGNDGTGNSDSTANNNSVADGVQGPLDQIQTPLSEDVLALLISAAAGTPLEGTLDCANQAVVIDLIDVLDSIALALMEVAETQDPAAFNSAAGNIQISIEEFANDLPGALTALAGEDCNGGDATPVSGTGENPLAGTPLAPLGDALAPVLGQIPASGGSGGDLDLQSLSALVHQLSVAFNSGITQVPAEARNAPIFGGLLTTLETALADLDITMMNLGVYDGAATAVALEVTLNHLLLNVLTEVIPVNFIEAQAGQPGVFSGPIQDGVNQATAALGDNLLSAAVPPLTDAMNGPLAVLLDPIENQLLPAILGPITDALAGSAGGTGAGIPPTGTPLDLLLGPVTDALAGAGGGTGGSGPTGTPLDLVLGPLLDAAGGTGGGCPLAGTPLEPACALLDAIPAP